MATWNFTPPRGCWKSRSESLPVGEDGIARPPSVRLALKCAAIPLAKGGEMSSPDDVIEALNYALELERQGYEFYDRLSRETKDARGRRMYERLREDEVAHRQVVEREIAALRATGEWSEQADSVPASVLAQPSPPIFEVERALEAGAAGARELQALERAIEAERKSRDFYAQQAQRTESPKGRTMWARLSAIEQGHLDLLTWEHDHIRGEGYWMDIAQFTMDEL